MTKAELMAVYEAAKHLDAYDPPNDADFFDRWRQLHNALARVKEVHR